MFHKKTNDDNLEKAFVERMADTAVERKISFPV